MHYTIAISKNIDLRAGEHVEVLDACYYIAKDEVRVRKLRINGRTLYAPRAFKVGADKIVPMLPHEGYVVEVEKTNTSIKLHITMHPAQ